MVIFKFFLFLAPSMFQYLIELICFKTFINVSTFFSFFNLFFFKKGKLDKRSLYLTQTITCPKTY